MIISWEPHNKTTVPYSTREWCYNRKLYVLVIQQKIQYIGLLITRLRTQCTVYPQSEISKVTDIRLRVFNIVNH